MRCELGNSAENRRLKQQVNRNLQNGTRLFRDCHLGLRRWREQLHTCRDSADPICEPGGMFGGDGGRARNPQQFRLPNARRPLPLRQGLSRCRRAKTDAGPRAPRLSGLIHCATSCRKSRRYAWAPAVRSVRMARKMKDSKAKPKRPPLRRMEATEATSEEFEREGMGIAPKE